MGLTRFRRGEQRKVRSRIGDCPKQSKFINADYNAFELKAA